MRTLNRVGLLDVRWHIEARLDAVAIGIGRSAYDTLDGGARIVAVHRTPSPGRTAPVPGQAPRALIRRDCGEILRVQ